MGHVFPVPEGMPGVRAASHAPRWAALPRRRSALLRGADGHRSLQVVDKFNDLLVSCYSTAGNTRLLMLHDSRLTEESLRAFFTEVHELYVKVRGSGVAGASQRRVLRPGVTCD